MRILTVEGVVEGGQIRVPEGVHLPENARVYVLVPDVQIEATAQMRSPRLLRPERAADFVMEVEVDDAGV